MVNRYYRRLLVVSALGAVLASACGRGGGGGSDGSSDEEKQEANGETAEAPAASEPAQADATAAKPMEFTADYKLRPVDVIIVRDGASRGNPVGQRLGDAIPTLASKLWNLASTVGSVHVGVVDHVYFDKDKIAPNTTKPIVDNDHKDVPVLQGETLAPDEFAKALKARVDAAGGRGGAAMPSTILIQLLSEAKKENGGQLADLFRADAFWAILYISQAVNPADPLDDRDVAAALKDRIGGVSISTLAPEKAGCVIADTTPEQRTAAEGTSQRNLEVKMQEATGGTFGSICGNEFVSFVDAFVDSATGTEYFPVTLPKAVLPETIKITASGVGVKEFRYQPGSTVLEISTKIKPGTKFLVEATGEGETPAVVVGTDKGDDVPKPGVDKLPPDQEAFLKEVQPVLQRACAGCHNGRPFNTNGGFVSAKSYRDDIARRIALPDSEKEHMPPKPAALSPADLDVLTKWSK